MWTFLGSCLVVACAAGPAPARDAAPPAHAIVGMEVLPSGRAVATSEATPQADCMTLPRATSDRPDFDSGRQVHVIYLVPSDAADDQLDTDGTLECSLRAQQEWIAQQSDGLEWRLDTFLLETQVGGETRTVAAPDITFVASPQPAKNLEGAGPVTDELEARGFDDPDKRYLTYVASGSGGGRCGDAWYPLPFSEPWSGQYSQVYLDAAEGCGSRQFGVPGAPSYSETIAQQELIHNDGMTPPGAPHGCLLGFPPGMAHVCTVAIPIPELDPERFDVMYPFAGVPLVEKKLDIGDDDYFRHPWPYRDLANTPFLRPVAERPEVPKGRSVSLRASRTTVAPGKRVTLSGVASWGNCKPGASVVLEARRESDDFSPLTSISTSADGSFEIQVRIRATRFFRALLPENNGCPAAVSREIEVRAGRG